MSQEVALFAAHGFVPRPKYARRMPELVPWFLFQTEQGLEIWESASPVPATGYSVEQIGVVMGPGFTGGQREFQLLVVTTPSGARVPAYRLGTHFTICQDPRYVPAS